MGMYTDFDYEDIEVLDLEAIKRVIKIFKEEYKSEYNGFEEEKTNKLIEKFMENKDNNYEKESWYSETNMIVKEEGVERFTFEKWTNMKLISYWYDRTCLFLEAISPYLRGEVRFTFENNEEGGYFEFKDEGCVINTGQMTWTEWKPIENIKSEIPQKIQNLLALNQLIEVKKI